MATTLAMAGLSEQTADSGTPINPKYSNENPRIAGSLSAKLDFTSNITQYTSELQLNSLGILPKLYLSMWQYVTTSGHASRNVKPIRLYNCTTPDSPDVSNVLFPASNYAALGGSRDDGSGYEYDYGTDGDLSTGVWERREYYFEIGDPGVANGNLYYWNNGFLKISAINQTLQSSGATKTWCRVRI